MEKEKKWVVDEKGYHAVTTWKSSPDKKKEPVEAPVQAAPEQKDEPEIR